MSCIEVLEQFYPNPVTERITLDGALGLVECDVAYPTALFVRYFQSMIPPLQASELAVARALGCRRFDVSLDQIAKRLGMDGR
jgi:hypothetical protein